jgi:hypothetical protein
MSTEVTPESLRLHAEWVHGDAVSRDEDTKPALRVMDLLLAKADRLEREQQRRQSAAAVLAAHGTPTLTPVGEHSAQGVRGLLPVVCSGAQMWRHDGGSFICDSGSFICDRNSKVGRTVLADPRPDGAA